MTSQCLQSIIVFLSVCVSRTLAAENGGSNNTGALVAGCFGCLVAIAGLGMWFRDTYMRVYQDFGEYGTGFNDPYNRELTAYTNPGMVKTISGNIDVEHLDTPRY